VCFGRVRILARAIVVAAMADLMYPLLLTASSNAFAAADLTGYTKKGAAAHRGHQGGGDQASRRTGTSLGKSLDAPKGWAYRHVKVVTGNGKLALE
jgi:hypothetical protein